MSGFSGFCKRWGSNTSLIAERARIHSFTRQSAKFQGVLSCGGKCNQRRDHGDPDEHQFEREYVHGRLDLELHSSRQSLGGLGHGAFQVLAQGLVDIPPISNR